MAINPNSSIPCVHAGGHLFANPLCPRQSVCRRVANVAFHIFTLGIPFLLYKVISCCCPRGRNVYTTVHHISSRSVSHHDIGDPEPVDPEPDPNLPPVNPDPDPEPDLNLPPVNPDPDPEPDLNLPPVDPDSVIAPSAGPVEVEPEVKPFISSDMEGRLTDVAKAAISEVKALLDAENPTDKFIFEGKGTSRGQILTPPVNKDISRLSVLLWGKRKYGSSWARLNQLLMEHQHCKEGAWCLGTVVNGADEIMQISFAIGVLALEELESELQKREELVEGAEALNEARAALMLEENTHFSNTMYYCSQAYRACRQSAVYRQSSVSGQFCLYPSLDQTSAYRNSFFEPGTKMFKWRSLYNEYLQLILTKTQGSSLQQEVITKYRLTLDDDLELDPFVLEEDLG